MILNRRNIPPSIDETKIVDCMRPGPWGNPFVEGRYGSREVVCWKFRMWLETGESFGCLRATEWKRQWILDHVHELRGKDLMCCCRPKMCHCETLEKMANGM